MFNTLDIDILLFAYQAVSIENPLLGWSDTNILKLTLYCYMFYFENYSFNNGM